MQLGVREVADLLNVNEKTIYRWINSGNLPGYRVNGHYRFNRAELLEWATAHRINVSVNIFKEPEHDSITMPQLSDALTAGGIFYRIEGKDKESALQAVVQVMRLPDEVDREFLLQVLLAREAMASTGVGEGIAIPHVRNPIVLHVNKPMVTLCFLEKAIDFGSLDGQPVNCLFTLVSPTVRSHLYLLSRLAFALKDPEFKQVIQRQGSKEEILAQASRVETLLAKSEEIQ
jgi:PTS system nitrogen regulatory IIA component